MKDIGVWLLVGVAVLVVLSGLFAPEEAPRVAPDFSLVSLDGETVTLSDHLGRVVLLDFWASWCKPCTRTFPELHALQARYADQGVDLLIVSLDKSEEASRAALESGGYGTENVLWGSLAEARAVKELFGVIGIPHTFLIDRTGLIRYSGYPTGLTAETIELWIGPLPAE